MLVNRSKKAPEVIPSSTIATLGPDGGLDIRPRPSIETIIDPGRPAPITPRGSLSKGSSSSDSSKLPRDSSNRAKEPADKTEESPAVILQRLMDRFIKLKETGGKAEAFKALQKSFAANAAVLSPYFIPLKDLMNLIMELETFIGKSGEHVGKTPEQVLRGFLQSGEINGTKIDSPYPISLDNDSKSVPIIAKGG